MCGICGIVWAGDTEIKRDQANFARKAFYKLLLLNRQRGTDSVGVGAVSANGDFIVRKKAVDPIHFVFNPKIDEITRLSTDRPVIIGHTRHATHGTVCDRNAHPFITNSILGIHNGVILTQSMQEFDIPEEITVDSEMLFHALSTASNYSDVLNRISGSAACAFVNADTHRKLFLLKLSNPLILLKHKKTPLYLFSSQLDHLAKAVSGSKDDFENIEVQQDALSYIDLDSIDAKLEIACEIETKKFSMSSGSKWSGRGTNAYPHNRYFNDDTTDWSDWADYEPKDRKYVDKNGYKRPEGVEVVTVADSADTEIRTFSRRFTKETPPVKVRSNGRSIRLLPLVKGNKFDGNNTSKMIGFINNELSEQRIADIPKHGYAYSSLLQPDFKMLERLSYIGGSLCKDMVEFAHDTDCESCAATFDKSLKMTVITMLDDPGNELIIICPVCNCLLNKMLEQNEVKLLTD